MHCLFDGNVPEKEIERDRGARVSLSEQFQFWYTARARRTKMENRSMFHMIRFLAFWNWSFLVSCPSVRRPVGRLGTVLQLLLVSGVLAQAQTNTGNIRGYVYDETRAVVPGTTVTAVDQSRGVRRQTSTSVVGEYFFSHLDPGLYTLRFEADNFAPYVIENFEARTGETELFSPQLAVATVEETIVISTESDHPPLAPDRTQQSDHIDFVSIQNLPINRRDYLDLALLTPGVVDTNYVADDRDFRIAPTPQSGLGIGGTGGRGNTFMLDGVTNVYGSGSVRSSIAQEAVREFQINRSSFSSELGGAPGGAINIVTKGGTNELHGSLFGVLRNRRFQARNFFDPGKSAYTRTQSGASIGGPISRDRTFFYSAYERLDRHESAFVPLLQDQSFLYQLTPSQQALANVLGSGAAPPQLVPLVRQLAAQLVPGNHPHVVSLFENNSGVFPFSEQRQQFLARIDHTVGDGHNLFLRGNWTGEDNQNTSFGSLVGYSRGRISKINDFSIALGDTLLIGPQWVSETRLGLAYHDAGTYPTDPYGPAIDINGFGFFGRDFILPARVVERAWQLRQNFTRVSDRHTFKFGVDINPLRDSVRAETFFSGRFIFGEAVPLASLIDSTAGAGTSQFIKAALSGAGVPELAAAVDEPISAVQSYALGLPIIYQQGFGDPHWTGWANRYSFFAEDSWRLARNFLLTLGVRHELEMKTKFPSDNNNFAPRAGFAWSPGDKTVIRGGYGMFYSRIDSHIVYVNDLLGDKQQIYQVFVPLSGLQGINSALTGQRLTSAEIYQTALARGILGKQQITPQDLAIHGIDPGPGLPLRVRFRVAPDIVNPYAQQGSFEIEREVAGYGLSAGYNFNRGIHLIRPLDVNAYRAGTNEQGRPIVGFHNPLILQDNIYGSWANSYYHALILQLKKRFSEGFLISAHHTWSKTIDENTDYNSSFEPHLQWDARDERALSSYHRGHRFVVNTVVNSPWETDSGSGLLHNLLSDFTLSGILIARSFAPFNLNAGYDNVGDRHTDTHRPWGVGRNTGIGPNFFTLDLRLNREFPFGESRNVEFAAEAFNLLNRTNFRHVNSTVGELSLEELPASLKGRRGPATEPFSFTSAFDPRQFQLSLRLNF